MNRDLFLSAATVLVGVCALVVYGRRCRRAPDVATSPRQPLQTWENEGGAVPDVAGPKPAKPRPEAPGA